MSNFYTEGFDQFASRLGPTDLALYAGAGIILWVLFKDKMSPVQVAISSLLSKFKKPQEETNVVTKINPILTLVKSSKEDVFFKLITSWKQTRDLAVLSGCEKAVEVVDQMFPFLSPGGCTEKESKNL